MNQESTGPDRRSFLSRSFGFMMFGALAASYGTFAAFAGRFLYPARGSRQSWLLVKPTREISTNDSIDYKTPAGAPVTITRRGRTGTSEDFLALSSTCPHLGCKVSWEPQNNRFFCPCHNGVFDPDGVATHGPPAEAHQSLPQYPLKVENGLLYIQVPTEYLASNGVAQKGVVVAAAGERDTRGPGHDPCLFVKPEERA